MKICARRKIWPETEQTTRPTGRGSCGGSLAEARTRKMYVSVSIRQKKGGTKRACDVLVGSFVVNEQETDSWLKNKPNVELLVVFKSLHLVLHELLSL